MKKFIAASLLILSYIAASAVDSRPKTGTEFRNNMIAYLNTNENYKGLWKINNDGFVTFKDNDVDLVLEISYLEQVSLFKLAITDSAKYGDNNRSKKNVETYIPEIGKFKAVNLRCMESRYSLVVEIFCQDTEIFKNTFPGILKEIKSAKRSLNDLLDANVPFFDYAGDPNGVFDKAVMYYNAEDYDKAFNMFKNLADYGFDEAYGYLGMCYEAGFGTVRDVEKMLSCYNIAIEAGLVWCSYKLGLYHYGEKEYSKALECFERCGSNENKYRSEALYYAGKMYEDGTAGKENISQAMLCYEKSVKYSTVLHCEAREALRRLGSPAENKAAFVDASAAMLKDLSVVDMYNKGLESEKGGEGRYVSLPNAYSYFKAAADRGYPKAYIKMGEIFESEYYPFMDVATAKSYYKKAWKAFGSRSDGEACYYCGYMYLNGLGTIKDEEKAMRYFTDGAKDGDPNAAYHYALYCKSQYENDEAREYFEKASSPNGLFRYLSKYELAKMYKDGDGVKKDKTKAVELFRECMVQDSETKDAAREALKEMDALFD